jgi:hypothetical protein
MTSDGRLRGPVIATKIDVLDDAGFCNGGLRAEHFCPVCGCRLGAHLAVLPGDTTFATLLDRVGMVECETCNRACGPWSIEIPGW